MEFEEIVQNFANDIYKECAAQPIIKFNRAILGYDNNHTLYEYYVYFYEYYMYFHEEVYDIIRLLWNISEQKVENINSFRAYKEIL